jgi:type II secretory pathway component PulM
MSDEKQFQFDPFKFGGLVTQVEHLQQKVDVMEADIKKLVAMAERSKGSLWALMGIASVAGAFISYISEMVFRK